MTENEASIVRAIRYLTTSGGVGPTYREISEATGIHLNTLFQGVRRLIEDGALHHTPGRARSLRVVERNCRHCGGML